MTNAHILNVPKLHKTDRRRISLSLKTHARLSGSVKATFSEPLYRAFEAADYFGPIASVLGALSRSFCGDICTFEHGFDSFK
jgi:hypothetical protein